MAFDARRRRALEILAGTGMPRANYAPPLHEFLWRHGVRVRPPRFASFVANALWAGAWFGAGLGAAMWLITVVLARLMLDSGMPILRIVLVGAGVAGIVFGLAMATYYGYGRRRHRLPAWRSLAIR